MDENFTAFISYSWDSPEHQKWVYKLVCKLRTEGGVDATYDQFITQESTVNLNEMMIQQIKNNEKIIIVLTENYASKCDMNTGGVGFEKLLTVPER